MNEHTNETSQRTTVAEAIAAWEAKGPTSLTVALMAEALYGAQAEALREAADLLVAECSGTTTPCFCSSAPWLRDRADALERATLSGEVSR